MLSCLSGESAPSRLMAYSGSTSVELGAWLAVGDRAPEPPFRAVLCSEPMTSAQSSRQLKPLEHWSVKTSNRGQLCRDCFDASDEVSSSVEINQVSQHHRVAQERKRVRALASVHNKLGIGGSMPEWEAMATQVDCGVNLVARLDVATAASRQFLDQHQRDGSAPVDDPKVPEAIVELAQQDRAGQWVSWARHAERLAAHCRDLLERDELQATLEPYRALASLMRLASTSSWRHLREFVQANMTAINQVLQARLEAELQSCLAELQYPECVLSTEHSIGRLTGDRDALTARFQASVRLAHTLGQVNQGLTTSDPSGDYVQILLQPLMKRFHYHFSGQKKTNSLVRPEWYLQQVKLWLERSQTFLRVCLSGLPVDETVDLSWSSAHGQMAQGLLGLVKRKLESDLPNMAENDLALSHIIDEVLLFTKDICDQGLIEGVPEANWPIAVLEQEDVYIRWLDLEEKYAYEKVENIILDEEGWEPSLVNPDVLKCVDSFLTLLQSLTARFKIVTSSELQLRFVALQCELLEDFRMRLVQILKLDLQNSHFISDKMTMILNSVDHIVDTVEDWGQIPFFLQLHSLGPSSDEDIFARVTNRFRFLLEDNGKNIGLRMAKEIQSRSYEYRHPEQWMLLESEFQHEMDLAEISVSALGMFQALTSGLDALSFRVRPNILKIILEHVAKEVSDLLVNVIILGNHFSELGVHQIKVDVSLGVMPLFRQFGYDPERYPLKKLREVVSLLELPKPQALLLKETLLDNMSEINSMKETLVECGLTLVHGSLALKVLKLRLDLELGA